MTVEQRRICWPNPDATCLEGGCIYCNDYPFKAVSTILRYARSAGLVFHRGGQQVNAIDAFNMGRAHQWYNAESRIK